MSLPSLKCHFLQHYILQPIWPYLKCIISFTTPRKDNTKNFTNTQIINALVKQKFKGVDYIFLAEHSNMLINGDSNNNLLKDDQYHLNDKGISLLAINIKIAIHAAVNTKNLVKSYSAGTLMQEYRTHPITF